MTPFSLNIRGRLHEYTHPAVMGILNITPDSFYEHSRATDVEEIRRRVTTMVEEGADFIDIGAYSTRPGCTNVPIEREMANIKLGMEIIREIAPDIPVSVDTFRSVVAQKAIQEYSADMINDISGGNMDEAMFETVANLKVPYILMHSRGDVENMHLHVKYDDFTADVLSDIAKKVARLNELGVNDVIIDPGFGFSKNLEQNYLLLVNLGVFQVFHAPLLVGVSRKSMITKFLNIDPAEAGNATTVINTIALQRGASILRVHDVKAAKESVLLFDRVANHERYVNAK